MSEQFAQSPVETMTLDPGGVSVLDGTAGAVFQPDDFGMEDGQFPDTEFTGRIEVVNPNSGTHDDHNSVYAIVRRRRDDGDDGFELGLIDPNFKGKNLTAPSYAPIGHGISAGPGGTRRSFRLTETKQGVIKVEAEGHKQVEVTGVPVPEEDESGGLT